ncbi:DsrE family protein [Haladaptatus litoreus]|nr:DsrE family protein [Haladaptatus litoreus]
MKTVFHVSTPEAAERSIAKVQNLLADETLESDTVAVLFDAGEAIAILERDSNLADDVRKLLDWTVEYKVCSNAIQNPAVDESNLVAGVETVSSGVGELTRLQAREYAYIRL